MTEKHQLSGLFSAALLGNIDRLDYFQRSSLVESVCAEPVQFQSIPEYLDSKISKLNLGKRPRPRFVNNRKLTSYCLAKAEEWLAKGIRVRLTKEHPKLKSCFSLFRVIFTFGPLYILDNPTAMILNSRPNKALQADSVWLTKTVNLAKDSILKNWTLISSYGPITYSVVSFLAKGTSLAVVCDGPIPFMDTEDVEEKFKTEFSDIFHMETTLFISGFSPGVLPKTKLRWAIRDETAGLISEIILPCEVRPNGNMSRILESAYLKGKTLISEDVNSSSLCHCPEGSLKLRLKNNSQYTAKIAPKIQKITSINYTVLKAPFNRGNFVSNVELENYSGDLLIHYTRACRGPWPGQSWSEYLSDLIYNNLGSAHDAVDTLRRILVERKIRACGKWTRGSIPVVSFTETTPEEFGLICKWRRGLMRRTFEPYAIAFSKKALLDKGARKVVYAPEEDFMTLSQDAKAYFQLSSSPCADWTVEKEWRLHGDLGFENMKPSDWFVIAPNHHDAQDLRNSVSIKSLQIYVSHFGQNNTE